ncbi:MAG: FixH family protein [Candidatus Baltobacteraceae bacterium]
MRSIAVIAVVALLGAGCSASRVASSTGTASQNGLAVSMSFNPSPPTEGVQALTVTVRDAAGAAVKGAVVKVTTSMPSMSMDGPSATGTDNSNGTYTVRLLLQYATTWQFVTTVSTGGKTARAQVNQEVKS